VQSFGSITNIGSADLLLTQVVASNEGSGAFSPVGFPDSSANSPLRLKPGEAISFNVAFRPSHTGLQRGQILVFSNDPDTPVYAVRLVGTGLTAVGSSLDYGHDFVAMESPDFPNSPVLRAKTDGGGNFEFFLPPEQRYHYAIFDPVS